jgi:nicotinate-nucleotide adenylyltransferase
MRAVGVLGGTFDPVHIGHLRPAAHAVAALALDELVLVPAGNPPHKLDEPRTPFAHRFAMLALAVQDDDRCVVSDVEADRPGPTYTFDTLAALAAGRPDERLYFLMGSDSFAQIVTWHRWDELLTLADLVVLRRPGVWGDELLACVPPVLLPAVTAGAGDAAGDGWAHRIRLLDGGTYAISATDLRRRLAAGEEVGDAVPAAVRRYIDKHRLYAGGGKGADGR